MYKNIMVPTDGSGFDREAILVALRVAERCDAKVRLVRVISTGAYFGMAASPDSVMITPELMRAEQDAALAELYALAAECRSLSDVDVTADLELGPIADVLAGYARRNAIDLIVISSHGRRGIARLSLGSVTDSLIRGTAIPVLVVKPRATYLTPEATKEFHHIVVPLDGSALAEQILARVIPLLHVLAPSSEAYENDEQRRLPWWEKKVAGAKAYLTRRAAEVRAEGVPATIEVVIGELVPATITEYARRVGADLIAIATHGRGGFARVIHGSVADGVTKSAMSSILVFHPEKVLPEAKRPVSEPASEEATVLA